MILDDKLLDEVTARAKTSERLRMNFNLHDSLDAKAQRLLNALEPGTVLPVHRHPHTDETYVILRGRFRRGILDGLLRRGASAAADILLVVLVEQVIHRGAVQYKLSGAVFCFAVPQLIICLNG